MKWKTPTFILLLFLLFLLPKAYADITTVQTVNNFQLIVSEDSSIAFQHIAITNVLGDEFNITLSPTSGGVNGSSGSLRMYQVTGILRFTSENTTSLSLSASRQGVNIRVNGERYFSGILNIVPSEQVVIEWGAQGIDYISISLGLLGLAIMIVTPVYSTYQVKVKKNYMWIVYSIAMFAIGYGFVMGWMGG